MFAKEYNYCLKVGLVCTSTPHFPVDKAKTSLDIAEKSLSGYGFCLTKHQDIVKTPTQARSVADKLKSLNCDVLIILQGAFTWDNIVFPLAQEFADKSLIVWAVPEPAMTGGKLQTNSLCGAIMNCSALTKIGQSFKFVYGGPDDDNTTNEIARYLRVVNTIKRLRRTKFGLIGYRPTGFYSSTFDELNARKVLGAETVHISLLSLVDAYEKLTSSDVQSDVSRIKQIGKQGEATKEDIEKSAKLYRALLTMAEKEQLDCFGIKCWPELMGRGLNPCFVNGLLTEDGIITGCEADFDGTIAMVIEYYLTGQSPYFADLIHLDEKENTGVFWHCGAAAPSLAEEPSKITLQKQFRGSDRTTAIEFPLKPGRITIARLDSIGGQYQMFITAGQALKTEMILRGNPSVVKLDSKSDELLETIISNGVAHHFAIVYADIKDELTTLCNLLKIKVVSC